MAAHGSAAGQWRVSRSTPSAVTARPMTEGIVAARMHQAWLRLAAGSRSATRVFVRRYAFYDQNIGVVLGRAEALVIDTRSTYAQAREIQADLRELTDAPGRRRRRHARPLRPCLRQRASSGRRRSGVTSAASRSWSGPARRASATIAVEEPELADDLAEVVIDPPDRVFATHARIEVGGREVELRYLGRGHTDHDIVIEVPGTDVVFAGDLVENGNVPFFGDGYPLDWPATAAALAVRIREDGGVVVPGHGDHAGRSLADAQAASLAALRRAGRARRRPAS